MHLQMTCIGKHLAGADDMHVQLTCNGNGHSLANDMVNDMHWQMTGIGK